MKKIDTSKLQQVFESSGVENSETLVSELETIVESAITEHSATLVEEQTALLKTAHQEEIASLTESFVQEKTDLIQSHLDNVEEQKQMGKELISTLVDENDDLKDSVDGFESVKESLVEFTIEEMNTEFDDKLEMFFSKVAESWVEEKDEELTELAESAAVEIGYTTIAEALSNSGFDLSPSDDSVSQQLTDLEDQHSAVVEENAILKLAIKDIEKEVLIQESVDTLSDMEGEKLRSIAECMEFKDAESFKMALTFMQESVSSNKIAAPKVEVTPVAESKQSVTVDDVPQYVSEDVDLDDLVSATLSVMS